MQLINKHTDYAVRSLCHLASSEDQPVSVSVLADELGIPKPYLRRILQDLARIGILRSQRGKGGGFHLQVPLSEIRLMDLVHAFQGPLALCNCVVQHSPCPEVSHCRLREKVASIERLVTRELKSVSIASLLADEDSTSSRGGI